jgi:hypothetical protein
MKHYAGANVNYAINGRGVTLLAAAARDGNKDVAKLLIEYGVQCRGYHWYHNAYSCIHSPVHSYLLLPERSETDRNASLKHDCLNQGQ